MGMRRKLKREALKKKLKDMGLQKPNKRVSAYWKDYSAGRKI